MPAYAARFENLETEEDMKKTAQEIIDIIREVGAEDSQAVRSVLEDGEAMLSLGITDEDQEAVEDAWDLMRPD